jgi:hypothetical protein
MLSELEELVRRVDGGATLAALPDALVGHRLAGVADNAKIVRAGLMALGANPLVADAFAGRAQAERRIAAHGRPSHALTGH